jgi:hypothetical protein
MMNSLKNNLKADLMQIQPIEVERLKTIIEDAS